MESRNTFLFVSLDLGEAFVFYRDEYRISSFLAGLEGFGRHRSIFVGVMLSFESSYVAYEPTGRYLYTLQRVGTAYEEMSPLLIDWATRAARKFLNRQ